MLPKDDIAEQDGQERGFKAFGIDFENKKILGVIDGVDALKQAIRMALITPRYKYPMFSHRYGTDFENAFEGGYSKAMGRLKNAIYDSLIYDRRINGIDNFEFEKKGSAIMVKFKLHTIYGDMDYETEVK